MKRLEANPFPFKCCAPLMTLSQIAHCLILEVLEVNEVGIIRVWIVVEH